MHNLSFHPICYEAEISRGGGGGQRTLQSRKHTDPILRNRSGEASTRISSSYRHLEAHTHCVTGRDHSFSSRCVRGVSRRRVADGTHCSIESRERERKEEGREIQSIGARRGGVKPPTARVLTSWSSITRRRTKLEYYSWPWTAINNVADWFLHISKCI